MTILYTVLCFLISIVSLLLGLAPTVTLEDSGEFITAAASFGVPHPPGYPLYTLLAGLFLKSFAGLASPAYLANLFSAFMTALASIGLFVFFRLLLKRLALSNLSDEMISFLSAAMALFITHIPIYFRQSIITEVYGLYNLLTSLYLYLFVKFLDSPKRYANRNAYALAFLNCAMSLSHTLAIVFVPLTMYLGLRDLRHQSHPIRHLALCTFFGLLGLLPLLYLPLAGLHNPALYWGEPNTWRDFLHVVLRFQYNPHLSRPWIVLIEQMRENVVILLNQVSVVAVFMGVLGLIWVFKRHLQTAVFLFTCLLLTGPAVAFLTNFSISTQDALRYQDTSSLLTVFYLSHFVIWGAIILIAIADILEKIRLKPMLVYSIVCVGVACWMYRTVKLESKRGYTFAESLYKNMDIVVNHRPAVIITNWDPFTFPGIYFQHVLKLYPNLQVIDIEMLKGPWYVHHLERWYPGVFAGIEFERDQFVRMTRYLMARSPDFIASEYFDRYIRFVNAIIRKGRTEGQPVIVMTSRDMARLPPGVGEGLEFVDLPVGAQLKAINEDLLPTPNCSSFDFHEFELPENTTHQNDRMAQMLARFYAGTLRNWIATAKSMVETQKKPEDDLQACKLTLDKLKRFTREPDPLP